MGTATDCRQRKKFRAWRSRGGAVLVEFALAAMILILLTLEIFQLGFNFFAISTLSNGAREGARYGSVHPNDIATIKANVRNHLSFAGKSLVGVNVTFPDGINSADSRITVSLTYTLPTFVPGVKPLSVSRGSTMRIERQL